MHNHVSIQIAKELYQLGWRKHCNFLVYTSIQEGGDKIICMEDKFALSGMALGDIKDDGTGNWLPQLHEILPLLPESFYCFTNGFKKTYVLGMDKSVKGFRCFYADIESNECLVNYTDKNPHDAAAKLLMWYVKNHHVTGKL